MMKFTTYFVASVTLMLGTVYYAYYTYRQFYPTVLFLVSSKIAYMVIGNLLFAVALLVARIFKSLFFGQLRDTEVELLVDTAKYTIPETCLALTIFRNELSPAVIALFGVLIFIKLLHKLSKCRIEYMEQLLPLPVASQARVYLLLAALYVIDVVGVFLSVMHISTYGRSVLILFGFEFGLLIIYTINMTVRFVIQVVDAMTEAGLSSKGLYLMLTDMICEIVKFLTYLCFFGLIFVYYGIPIHILRDVYMAYTSCARKVVSFIKYLQLTRNLDSRFEDATPEEVAAAGHCLVCREDLTQGKKLRCGHVFHLDCLRMWLQHQQSCPLCRANISVAETAPAPAAPAPGAEGAVPVPGPAPVDGAHGAGAAVPAGQIAAAAPEGQVAAGDGVGAGAGMPAPAAPVIPGAAVVPAPVAVPAHRASTPVPVQNASAQQPLTSAELAKASGPRVFGVHLSRDKALQTQRASFPRFCIVAAQPDVSVLRDPVRNAAEIRRINTGTIVFVTLRVMGGDGSSWLKAPDGWILECNGLGASAQSTFYSMIAVSEASSSGDASSQQDSVAQEQRHGISGEKATQENNRTAEPARASPAIMVHSESASAEVESSPSKTDASGARVYSRDHQRNSRLFEQFESKRQYSQPDQSHYGGGDKSASPAEQPFPPRQSEFVPSSASGKLSPAGKSSERPPFSSIIDCSEEEASWVASVEANGRQVARGVASATSEEQQIEECLLTLQSLLARHRGPHYDSLHEAITSASNETSNSDKQGAGKLQRLAQMQSHMEQVAGNLVALSSNVLQCQQTLEKLISDTARHDDTADKEVLEG